MQQKKDVQKAYDQVAANYVKQFYDELDHKPLDRKLLALFAERIPSGEQVLEVGCGPGEIAVYLNHLGVNMLGTDLSEQMIAEARRLRPDIPFEPGDMTALKYKDAAFSGIIGFYAIVNLPLPDIQLAFREFYRLLKPGGHLLISFHIGDEIVKLDEFLEHKVALEFYFHQPDILIAELEKNGFQMNEVVKRGPYKEFEHPSERAYLFAEKP